MKIDVIKMLEKAIENNLLKEFLLGNEGFDIPNFSGFKTDKDVVLFGGIYSYYRNNPNDNFDILYQNTLCDMLDGNLFEILNSLDYAFMQILAEKKGIAPFVLSPDFYLKLKQSIVKNENLLKKCKNFSQYGSALPNGAYEYAERLNNYCEETYGRKIF